MPTAAEIFGPRPVADVGDITPRQRTAPILSVILHDVEIFIRRYVVLTDEQAIAVTLWTAHTHVIAAADCTPYLQVTSATKRAGKTRLLEVLEPLVARPWLTQRVSAAALVRKIDAEHPTLLLDESDAAFKGDKEYAEALRGLLNSGYRRSGHATICVGQGSNLTYKDFSTFSAKAIAGIGELPDTIADRAIAIGLKRRTSDEPCVRWRERDGHAEAAPWYAQLVAWAGHERLIESLRSARPVLPGGLGDRQSDVWEPLLALAELAGGAWPDRARLAALGLAGSVEDSDISVELLKDIRGILIEREASETVIPTKDLIAWLVEQDDRPWATWRHDKPITARGLARLLGPLGAHPVKLERVRGYRADAFNDAIARYLPFQAPLRQSPNKTGPESQISIRQEPSAADASKIAKKPDFIEEMAHGHIDRGEESAGEDTDVLF